MLCREKEAAEKARKLRIKWLFYIQIHIYMFLYARIDYKKIIKFLDF